jgi:hypothetical protein
VTKKKEKLSHEQIARVRFKDGRWYDPEKVELETRADEPHGTTWVEYPDARPVADPVASPSEPASKEGKVKVADQSAADRLMQQIRYEQRRIDVPLPNRRQVAMMLHALADHTAIMSALQHRRDDTSPWPEATSIGRWLHELETN